MYTLKSFDIYLYHNYNIIIETTRKATKTESSQYYDF